MFRMQSPCSGRGFTLIELLVVIAIISIISSLVVPSLLEARRRAQITQCASGLKQIYAFAMSYSDKLGSGHFPFGADKEPRAHESLNQLLEYDAEALDPSLFVCPSSDAAAAKKDAGGSYTLAEENLGYAWVARRLKNTAVNKPLASCKYVDGYTDEDGEHAGHRGGMNVLMTDGSVRFVPVSELDPETLLPVGLTR